ncbi:Dehydrodolichyl diphosphate synthase [Dictyocoela roeselum]|nr:Dehydrodolichyl diphosphate synthase [Dictyocoela roeselum]
MKKTIYLSSFLLKIIQRCKFMSKPRIYLLRKFFLGLKVAFIMDGNRRYGKLMGISDLDAKTAGRNKLLELIYHSYRLGIKEITVYALSVDNLKRDPIEIENLRSLMDEDVNFGEKDEVGCNFRPKILFHGSDIDTDTKKKIEKIENQSGHDMLVNVMYSYSGTMEYEQGLCFVNRPDIIIRTSAVHRLSDFLIIHAANGAKIKFVDPLWPMYSIEMYEQNLLEHVLEDRL